MKLAPGNQLGSYRIIGSYPGGGYRAVCGPRRVRISFGRVSPLLSGLDHPGIARIVDRGVVAAPEPSPWFACELAEGLPLSEILARRTLALDETLELLRDLASILRHLHGRGLVHDALDPAAVIVRTGARDFPIQLGGWSELRSGDGAQDIHALGVIAYRGITGRFPGMHPPELVPGVSGYVSALIVRMLAIEPAARPSAADIATEIAALTDDAGPLAAGPLAGPRFARPRWTPAPAELQLEADAIVLPRKRPACE